MDDDMDLLGDLLGDLPAASVLPGAAAAAAPPQADAAAHPAVAWQLARRPKKIAVKLSAARSRTDVEHLALSHKMHSAKYAKLVNRIAVTQAAALAQYADATCRHDERFRLEVRKPKHTPSMASCAPAALLVA